METQGKEEHIKIIKDHLGTVLYIHVAQSKLTGYGGLLTKIRVYYKTKYASLLV